jgi:hypothetical protein
MLSIATCMLAKDKSKSLTPVRDILLRPLAAGKKRDRVWDDKFDTPVELHAV